MTIATAVQLDPPVREQIYDHVFESLDREVGGILLGPDGDEGRIRVSAALDALSAESREASVTFTQDSWSSIYARMEREHAGQAIVGWYHSHPGFGVFLSDHDLFIHRSFFTGERQVAYVVDPRRGVEGWFGWHGDAVEKLSETPTERAPLPPSKTPRSTKDTGNANRAGRLAPLAAATLVGVLAGASAALVMGDDSGAGGAASPALGAERQRVAELQARLDELSSRPAKGSKGSDTSPANRPERHLVREGDTLSALSRRYYGDAANAWAIAGANGLQDLDHIATGTHLVIPARALVATTRQRRGED